MVIAESRRFPELGRMFYDRGPAMNVAVAFYVAHWIGYEPSVAQMIAAPRAAAREGESTRASA